MILTDYIDIKIAPSNYTYWKNKGYNVRTTGGRGGKNSGQVLQVKVGDLLPKSCAVVQCRCETCGKEYSQRYSRDTIICYPCRKIELMRGNNYAQALKGRKIPSMSGELHPRWNPNKPAYKKFLYKVQRLSEATYGKHKATINPHNHPRTLCGVENGYQLDHIISVKKGFDTGMTPMQLADLSNLQMLPWSVNLAKRHK